MPIISSLKIDISVTVAALAHSAAMRALSLGKACPCGTGQAPGGTGGALGPHRAGGLGRYGRAPRAARTAPWAARAGGLGRYGRAPRAVRAGASGGTGGR